MAGSGGGKQQEAGDSGDATGCEKVCNPDLKPPLCTSQSVRK